MTVDYNCRISTIKQSKPVHNRHGIRERSKMGLGPKCGYVRLKRCWMVRGGATFQTERGKHIAPNKVSDFC